MAKKEKEGSQLQVSEMKPWPTYIEVSIVLKILPLLSWLQLWPTCFRQILNANNN